MQANKHYTSLVMKFTAGHMPAATKIQIVVKKLSLVNQEMHCLLTGHLLCFISHQNQW